MRNSTIEPTPDELVNIEEETHSDSGESAHENVPFIDIDEHRLYSFK